MTPRNKNAEILIQRGIKPSCQRLYIYEYLLDRIDHPTADNVWEGLVEKIPTLSRTTVYTTLNLLCNKGLVTLITGDYDRIRFDAVTSQHAHFCCDLCKCVYNVGDTSLDPKDFQIPAGAKIHGVKVYVSGLCVKCVKESAPIPSQSKKAR